LKEEARMIFDISQTLHEGMAVWPGDPEYRPRWMQRIRNGEPSNVSAVDMGVHTGTHIDAPLHLDDRGGDIAGMPMRCFMGRVRVHSMVVEECIRAADLSILDWEGVERVLFKTRASSLPEGAFHQRFIYFDKDAAAFLAEKNVLLVGTDAPSVDSLNGADLLSHRVLLDRGIAVLEGARLEDVPSGDYELICLPLKLAGLEASPVRAILIKD
jgi:arylformamidase